MTISGNDLVAELLADPKVKAEFDKESAYFDLKWALIDARRKAKMSQADVAEKMGTTQSVIARIESGRASVTLDTIRRFARATGQVIKLEIAA